MIFSVGVYKNIKTNSIEVIPNYQDVNGVRRYVNQVTFLEDATNIEDIGKEIKKTLIISVNTPVDNISDVKVFEQITGKKGWANFYNHRFLVSIRSDMNTFIEIVPTEKILKEKSYNFLENCANKISFEASNEVLGDLVNLSFTYCK